ncbi:MAG: hypothetical protein IJQ10_02520, partial [Clostridia bacterium]|nr:hypothetical protein [Clostridia bacterium]
YTRLEMITMSENKENKKNKNLNEKEIEKVSGGQKIDPKSYENHQKLLAYWKEIKSKEKTSSPTEPKNLQPFPDEDKN